MRRARRVRETRRDGDPDAPPRARWVVVGGVLTFGVLLGVWVALAGQVDGQDLIAGAMASAVAVAVGFGLSQQGRALPRLCGRDAARVARFPWQLVVESAQVFALAARKAAGREVRRSSWVEVPVELGGTGWRAARRDSVITVLMSVAPGDIVADTDADTGVALVHRLIASRGDAARPGPAQAGTADRRRS